MLIKTPIRQLKNVFQRRLVSVFNKNIPQWLKTVKRLQWKVIGINWVKRFEYGKWIPLKKGDGKKLFTLNFIYIK